ncbi:MAG: YkgJ family cysteine cluster protein [Helicobacteraceae bacterium]|jgi:Fe-S-cluster containining protein|nr:YkgJ family cysteine cluster protein [Helicobacteraceae bacterium]
MLELNNFAIKTDDLIRKDGLNFSFNPAACESCGSKCCVGDQGDVWVSDDEVRAISNFFNMEYFTAKSIYFIREREGLRVKEIESDRGYECIFLSETGCEIYEVRPKQCKDFPFWENMNENLDSLLKECAGVVK